MTELLELQSAFPITLAVPSKKLSITLIRILPLMVPMLGSVEHTRNFVV